VHHDIGKIRIPTSYHIKSCSISIFNQVSKKVNMLRFRKAKVALYSSLIILVFAVFSDCFALTFEPQPNLQPMPYFTSPSNDEFMSTVDPNVVKVFESDVELRVVDLADEDDIIYAFFYFSFDGIEWLPIGEDHYNGFEGIQFTGDDGQASTNGWGGTGWNIFWHTEGLEEGPYLLRATLFDQLGQQGTTEILIHFDPTPPFLTLDSEPSITEGILGPLEGLVYFNSTTLDEDPAFFSLDYIDASRPQIDQQGLGNANQENVGTPDTKGTPQTDDDVNNFCGPTSAANALWRLGQNDPALLGKSGGGQFNNATELAGEIGNDTKTDPVKGTATDDMTAGLRKFLKKRNLDGNYTVKPHIPKQGERGPWWSDVGEALRQGEAVIMLKVRPGADGTVGTADDIGHYETGKDANPYPGGGGELSVRDPKGPEDKSGRVKVVPKNNGFEGIWFDEDGDGEEDDGEVWYLLAFWEISPNNEYTWGLQEVAYVPLGEDVVPSDGFGVPVETNQIQDGFYLLRGRMYDATGNVGMNRTTIYINNHSPNPVVLETPALEDVGFGSVTLRWTQNLDEDFSMYQIFVSSSEGTLGNVVQSISDWTVTSCTLDGLESETDYYFTVRVVDFSGLGADSSQIQVHTTVIPEFQSWSILLLFVIATLAVLVYRTRTKKGAPHLSAKKR
jgi:hypothetical protein